MDTIKMVASRLNVATILGQEQKAILDTLELTVKDTERYIRFELLNNIDQSLNDNIPLLHLLELTSHTGVGQTHSSYDDYYKFMSTYMNPLLENCSPIVSNMIRRLFTYSLLIQFSKQTEPSKMFSRKYLFTDQVNIYVLDVITCNFQLPRPELFTSLSNVYCVVTSKATVDVKAIEFPSLAEYYQRQLTSCGISKHALNFLYHDLKDTYYKLINPKGTAHKRWEL